MKKEVALIQMPFATATMPSLSHGILKEVLEKNGIGTDVYYLNVKFAKLIDLEIHEQLCHVDYYTSEWLFAQVLYHSDKFEDLKHDYSNYILSVIDKDPLVYGFLRRHKSFVIQMVTKIIPQFVDECINTINWNQYQVISFKCIVGNQLACLLMANKIKEKDSNTKIIFGGPNVRGKMGIEHHKSFKFIDYIIDGEGERTLPELVNSIIEKEQVSAIDGITYREDDRSITTPITKKLIDLNEVPIPDYTDYFKEVDAKHKKSIQIPIESSRGCWWGEKSQCGFCALTNGFVKYRSKTSNRLLNEILLLSEKYNTYNFYATDCILDPTYFKDFFPMLEAESRDFNVFYEIKPYLSFKELRMLIESGVKTIQAGIESISSEMLKVMRKGGSAIQNIQFLKYCTELGIQVDWNFLYRVPGESVELYLSMIDLIPKIIHIVPPTAQKPKTIDLRRYSPYFDNPKKFGVKDIKPLKIYSVLYPQDSINLYNIASEFTFRYDESEKKVKSYIGNLTRAMKWWQESFRENKYVCSYTLRNHKMIIIDNRHMNVKTDRGEYTYELPELEKEILLCCNEISSFDSIYSYLGENYSYHIDTTELIQKLESLVKCNLIFKEDDLYLNLAIERKSEEIHDK